MFEYIKSSDIIPALLAEKRFGDIVRHVMNGCYEKAASIGEMPQSIAVLATGLLHYILTSSQIPSQRKVEFCRVDVDIVIPDLKTLEKNPQKALLVCIMQSVDPRIVADNLASLEKIQPVRENICVVHSGSIQTAHKSFLVSRDGEAFSGIISELEKFAGDQRFRILGNLD
ncbi:MAG: hypothetical protein D9C04_01625 [Nitrosopumilus sp. B06]|nr:MAG: hypothetical protein D9C04_01625 [Nitrosopumilus sp. B06]